MAEFKVGDRVVGNGGFLQPQDSSVIGTVTRVDNMGCWIDWGVVNIPGVSDKCQTWTYNCFGEFKRVPSYQSIHITTDGRITNATLQQGDKVIRKAMAKYNPSDETEGKPFSFKDGAMLAVDRLFDVREVKREAKIGDWVKIVDGGGVFSMKPGDIYEAKTLWSFGGSLLHCRYVVLEGYQPSAPPKPKYYTGKVVCVEFSESYWSDRFEVGKVYRVEDGCFIHFDGIRTIQIYTDVPGKNEPFSHAKFIEYKGECK